MSPKPPPDEIYLNLNWLTQVWLQKRQRQNQAAEATEVTGIPQPSQPSQFPQSPTLGLPPHLANLPLSRETLEVLARLPRRVPTPVDEDGEILRREKAPLIEDSMEDWEQAVLDTEIERLRNSNGTAPPVWSEMEEFAGMSHAARSTPKKSISIDFILQNPPLRNREFTSKPSIFTQRLPPLPPRPEIFGKMMARAAEARARAEAEVQDEARRKVSRREDDREDDREEEGGESRED